MLHAKRAVEFWYRKEVETKPEKMKKKLRGKKGKQ